MPSYRVVDIREETPAEAARRAWFEQQALASPDALEAAARLLIGLVTGLLGVLFGVLTVASDRPPAYLGLPLVRGLGVATVALLLAGLVAALVVVLPRRWTFHPARPADEAAVFQQLLRRKALALTVAAVAFGLGIVALGGALILALLAG